MKKLQKPAKTSRAARRPPVKKRPKVSVEVTPEPVPYIIEMRGQCRDYLEDLVSRHRGELERDGQVVVFLNRQEAGKLLDLAAPIEFRVGGETWVLGHGKYTGWILTSFLGA